jgi:hypothetical protein
MLYLPAPFPLRGLGDNWSNNLPQDKAAQNCKAVAPQRASDSSPEVTEKKMALLSRARGTVRYLNSRIMLAVVGIPVVTYG